MARPRKPVELHVLQGSHRVDRHGEAPENDGVEIDGPTPVVKLKPKRKQVIWDEWISKVPWLTKNDSMTCMVFVDLYYEFEKDSEHMQTSRISLLNKYINDLGLSPVSRSKVSADKGKEKKNPNDEHFD